MAATKVAGTTVEIEGAKELRKSLKGVEDGLKDLTTAHRAAAGIVAEAAAARAPRRTGALASSIRPSGTKAGAVVQGRVVYAGVIEWGWPAHNIPAQPFIVPAAQETEGTWRPAYDEAIAALLAKVEGA